MSVPYQNEITDLVLKELKKFPFKSELGTEPVFGKSGRTFQLKTRALKTTQSGVLANDARSIADEILVEMTRRAHYQNKPAEWVVLCVDTFRSVLVNGDCYKIRYASNLD